MRCLFVGASQIVAANISFLRNFGTYDKHSFYQYFAPTRLAKSHRDEILVENITQIKEPL